MKVLMTALNAHFMHTSLPIRLLKASVSENADLTVETLERHINLPFRRVLQEIVLSGADVFGFSCYIWNIDYVLRLCRAIKKARPGCVIFLGGPEASCSAEILLSKHDEIDHILFGEGETVLPAYLAALKDGGVFNAPGVYQRDETSRVFSNPAPAPLPPELWPDVYAEGIKGIENRLIYIETSRGCPYGCRYCLSSGDKVRALDANEAVRRLTFLAENGAKIIKLVDRTFNFDKKRANVVWNALIDHALETGVRPTYHFEIAANLIDEAAARVIARAPKGLFQFEVGIQSSNPDVLDAVGRSVSFEKVSEGTRRLAALGNCHLHVDLIAGLPHEDMASFRTSFNETWALGAEQLQLGFLKLLHGSGLRTDADKLGLIFEDDAPYEIISTPKMSFDELCFLKDVERVLDYYANSGRYPLAMALLTKEKPPFDVLADLAVAMRRDGLMDIELGEKARASALLTYSEGDKALLGALIRHDFLKNGRRLDLPEKLAFRENDAQRLLLRERFHPVRGQSAYEYEFDLKAYLETGCLTERSRTAIYDGKGHVEWLSND